MFSLAHLRAKVLLAVVAVLSVGRADAAFDHARTSADHDVELVVYEARHSPYSQVFRTSNLPVMLDTARPRGVPVRFIDVLATSDDGSGLVSPIDVVPTIVMFRDGQEQGRIVGLFGPSDFMRMLGALLRAVD